MRVSKNLVAVLTLLMVVGLVLAACGGGTTTTTGVGTDTTGVGTEATAPAEAITVKIGAEGPFTGDMAKLGSDALQSVKMAVDDFNASGKATGITFVVEVADDAGDPAKASTVAEKLASDEAVVGVVGPMNSGAVKAALPIFDSAGLPMVTQSATNDDLSSSGYTVFHRITPKDSVQGPSIAQFMVDDLKVKKVFIIDDKSTYGAGLAQQAADALKEAGVEIQQAQITDKDKDFSSVLTTVKAFGPDLLFVPLPVANQAAGIAKQAKSMGVTFTLFGADGVRDPTEFIKNAGGTTEGAYATSLGPMPESVPAAQDFMTRYIAKYKETSAFTAQSYEAANVLMEAIVAAGVKDGKVDRAAVNDALGKTNYTGILGFPIAFTPEGDLAEGGIFVVQVQGDKFVPVKSITLK